MPASTLKIGGLVINRPAARVVLDNWTLNLDRPDELEFTELGVNLPGSYHPEQTVTLTISSVIVFSGWIFSRFPANAGTGEITIGYRCLSLKYGAYMVPITASDGTGLMPFNLPTSDPVYQAAFAGKSVGDILGIVWNTNSAQLGAIGVSTDGTTTSQLAALTVVPPDPVYMQGPSLWAQIDNLLQQWYGSRYAAVILGNGLIRIVDTYSLSNQTLTLGTDPIILTSMSEDTSESYTQVKIRGRQNVYPAVCSLSDGTLIDPNITAEASWKLDDYLYPKGGYSEGNITGVTSTQITVQSDLGSETWGVNYWSNRQAQVSCIYPLGVLASDFEYKHITANTALTAGGTSVLTLDSPLSGSSYTRYQIRGVTAAGPSQAYRRYNIKNTYVAQHLVPYFPFAVPFQPAENTVTQTTQPQSIISYTSAGLKFQVSNPFEIVPYDGTTNGYILFYSPVVMANNTMTALQTGGAAVTPPANVQVFVPYSVGALGVQSPAGGGYSGTAFSVFGVQRTLYRDYQSWIDPRQSTALQALADALLATVSQALQEGSVTYYGQYLTALTPGSPITLSLAHFSLTTGYETMQAPCRSVTLEWPQEGGSIWITRLNFSTRRQAYSGDSLYVHPNYAQGMAWGGLTEKFGGFTAVAAGSLAGSQLGQAFAKQLGEQMKDPANKAAAERGQFNLPDFSGSPLAAPSATSNIPMGGQMDLTGMRMSRKEALQAAKESKEESLAASKAAGGRQKPDQIAAMRERVAFKQQFGALPRQNLKPRKEYDSGDNPGNISNDPATGDIKTSD